MSKSKYYYTKKLISENIKLNHLCISYYLGDHDRLLDIVFNL